MSKSESKLSMGPGTLEIPVRLFDLNRIRLLEELKKVEAAKNSLVFLQGGDEVPFYDTDISYNVFRQESYFMWAFGVIEAGCYGAINTKTNKSYLFIPRLPEAYAIWMGPLLSPQDYLKKYEVDYVHYIDEMVTVLNEIAPSKLLTIKGKNSDSGLESADVNFEGIEKFNVDKEILFPVIAELRVYKTELELKVMCYVTEVSSAAHRKVMRMAKAGTKEYQCESKFIDHCYSVGGCRFVSYTCICGSGHNGAVLHYGHAGAPNSRTIERNDMCLFDMGANYFGYCADITCSFPENGKFNEDQKLIYNAVLDANLAVFKALKPGVSWVDMHHLALRTILAKLVSGGLLKGDVDEMMAAGLGTVFQPHGLGHLIGLDVHDVGGYLPGNPERPSARNANKLRTARAVKKGMCLTIEPGCYFVEKSINDAMQDEKLSKFLIPEALERFKKFGGVRIEDDVYITDTGCVNMTKVPRTIKEIEDWIASVDNDSKYQ